MSEAKSGQAAVQQLCAEIAAEENPNKVDYLVESLRNSVEIEREEARLRLRMIAQRYRERIQSAPLKTATTMLDVLSFLGLTRSHASRKADGQPDAAPDEASNEDKNECNGEKPKAA